MKLHTYIESFKNKTEAREILASKIGCAEVTVKSWANGNRSPHKKWWSKIASATDGSVTIADFVE